jgi:SAM-dependent methyltransferase
MTIVSRLLEFLRARRYSSAYSLTEEEGGDNGWTAPEIAERQHRAYAPLLENVRQGKPRRDLQIAAQCVVETGLVNPSLLEIGCGSGYYSEILALLAGPLRYLGLDYSAAMIAMARRSYPAKDFLIGDGTSLPLLDRSVDIVLSGNSLMHIRDYRTAIEETARVARSWCIFHTVPILQERSTTILQKRAYGVRTVEIIFNRQELEEKILSAGLRIRERFDSIDYDLKPVLGERTAMVTYLCERPGERG